MKIKKTTFLVVLLASILILFIPIYNIFIDKNGNSKRPFNIDFITSYFNYSIYNIFNRSMRQSYVIAGKENFLFLGNRYDNVIRKTNGIFTISNDQLESYTDSMKKLQQYYESQDIKFIYVIAPNKHTVYKEYLPNWVEYSNETSTDTFVKKSKEKGINILDLREIIINSKTKDKILYSKTDTHWNRYGASIAYNSTMGALNLQIVDYQIIDSYGKSGDLIHMLKIDNYFGNKTENYFDYNFSNNNKICIGKIYKNNGAFAKCELTNNKDISILYESYYSSNINPVNNNNLLLIGDSFLGLNSKLYSASFANVWRWHWNNIDSEKLKKFVSSNKPDIVIYQIVERNLLNEHFFSNINLTPNDIGEYKNNTIIFDIKDSKNDFTINKHLGVTKDKSDVSINANGHDPQITLRKIYPDSISVVLQYELISTNDTKFQIFFKKNKNSKYNENDSIIRQINEGKNIIEVIIPSEYLKNGLRIDPVSTPGNYKIIELRIYEK